MRRKIGLLIIVVSMVILILQLYNLLSFILKNPLSPYVLDQMVTTITLFIIIILLINIGIMIRRGSEDIPTGVLIRLLWMEILIDLGRALIIVSLINILYILITMVFLPTVDILARVTYIIMWVIILTIGLIMYSYFRRKVLIPY